MSVRLAVIIYLTSNAFEVRVSNPELILSVDDWSVSTQLTQSRSPLTEETVTK